MLGVGQDATEEGRPTGTQLSLFDVSNLREPDAPAHRASRPGLVGGGVRPPRVPLLAAHGPRRDPVRAARRRLPRRPHARDRRRRPHRARGGEAGLRPGRPPLAGRPRQRDHGLGRGRQVELAGDAGRARLGRVPGARRSRSLRIVVALGARPGRSGRRGVRSSRRSRDPRRPQRGRDRDRPQHAGAGEGALRRSVDQPHRVRPVVRAELEGRPARRRTSSRSRTSRARRASPWS